MKKIVFIALAMMMVAPYAFADNTSTSTNFTLGSTSKLTVGLSNEVTARYINGGATKPQWYAIGTYHVGGDKVFGTAQDITNIYKQEKDPGEDFTWTGMPADSSASSSWSASVWSAL
jgi:hypothetical protein